MTTVTPNIRSWQQDERHQEKKKKESGRCSAVSEAGQKVTEPTPPSHTRVSEST
jgi:hypothetical protein